ncbi:MAG: UDP-N-acetylmuramoyl-L-alanyl-D-glutamate--2,6-diaminopimelate ligase [Patescibacteria group bacterium]
MLQETIFDKILYYIRKLIPKSVFAFFQPHYHTLLSHTGAIIYGFPSKSMKVIGVTGTKGKSTTVYLISKVLEAGGHQVAAIGSLGYKIKDKEWPNTLKMTMPGRFRLQKFLSKAKKAGCTHVVLEVTSEGIRQKRHLGIDFDCAVFTNLHKEHIEAHGSFENYLKAKQELFKRTSNIHVINVDDPHAESFGNFLAHKKIFYGLERGEMRAINIKLSLDVSFFDLYSTSFTLHFGGKFNIYNALAALSVGAMYGVDLPTAQPALESINNIPGRMEFVQKKPFSVVVDYAHTPDSLEAAYGALSRELPGEKKLICVLGAAGGGRDTWKRPEFGRIADQYCREIILTNEDPYEEDPEKILNEVAKGIKNLSKIRYIMDREQAIGAAIRRAQDGDIVVITGKGSETTLAVAGGKKIPWSDRRVVLDALKK